MQRFKLTIEYDGRPFVGWQIQKNGPSVQQALKDAVKAFSGEDVAVEGAGRTDRGVHALAQTAHLDLKKPMTTDRLQGALNYHLKPHPVTILSAETVGDDFHARFSARRRLYRYRIVNRRARLSFDEGLAWHVAHPLNTDVMNEATQYLIGKHDFTTFRHIACQARSPVKTLELLTVESVGTEVFFHVMARSFLHHQVRSIVGTLVLVGLGKWQPLQVKAALEACDRCAVGYNAPPDGLYLTDVIY